VSDDNMPASHIPPHPTLPDYYGTDESRQRFLNDLFDRTAHRYRAVDRAIGFGSVSGIAAGRCETLGSWRA
jgi:hypothetical protein